MVLPGTHITPCGGTLPRQQLGALNRNLLALDVLASGVESALQASSLLPRDPPKAPSHRNQKPCDVNSTAKQCDTLHTTLHLFLHLLDVFSDPATEDWA